MKEAIAYFLAITISEAVTVFIHPLWGIFLHIVILVALILHAVLTANQTKERLFLSLALVPLIRIISLSIPLAKVPQIWWYPITYAPLLAGCYAVMRAFDIKLAEVGLTFRGVPVQLIIGLTGFIFGLGEYFILSGEAKEVSRVLGENRLLAGFFLMISTGFVEELMFRGVLQRTSVATFGWWGIVYVSLLFAVVHLIHDSLLDIAYVFAVAMFLGWAVKRTGSLLGVTLSHGIANIMLYLVLPLFF